MATKNVDILINNTLVEGLTRVFAHFDTVDGKYFHEKLQAVQKGLMTGEAPNYRHKLESIIKNCNATKNWGLFDPAYIEGLYNMLERCGKRYNLFTGPITEQMECSFPNRIQGNIFLKEQDAKKALRRLSVYGKTNISYKLVEEYGVEKLQKDLRNAGYPAATVTVNLKDHQPDHIYEVYYYSKAEPKGIRAFWPLMPLVIINANDPSIK